MNKDAELVREVAAFRRAVSGDSADIDRLESIATKHEQMEAELTRLRATLDGVKELPKYVRTRTGMAIPMYGGHGSWIRAADLERVIGND